MADGRVDLMQVIKGGQEEPVLLLNERCPDGPRYEVINLGIPHLTSAQIVSLFLAEGVPLPAAFTAVTRNS